MTDGRRAPHPANTLNELTGEEWLYFTKSLLTTAYPSELGHAARRVHGANKPPRLMARLIEFFSRSGELVLDPFAGVGGTLLGAAIARGPRRALGIELDPRWAAVFEQVVRDLANERDGAGPGAGRPGPADPGGPRPFDPSGVEMRVGDALALLPTIADGSVDLVATDPPYNLQLPMTMAGGALAETHANRRTDYAMVTDSADDLANAADYPTFLDRMERVFGELERVLRPRRLRGGHRARRVPGRALRLHRLGPRRRGRRPSGSSPRAISSGTRRGRGCARTAIRAPSSRTSSTSTSWCSATKPARQASRRRRDSR